MIYIYDDGVHSNAHVHIAIQTIYPNMPVQFCTSSMIINRCLDNARLLVIPGGADLYNCEKLNGAGNQIIRTFVANGGAYLGICAGAYYGCSSLDWNNGEIGGARELAFTTATATGPVYEWLEKPNAPYDGSWIYAAELKTPNGQTFLTQYNGGPVFDTTECDVIARYTELKNQPPAIISGDFGKGRYILSSPHIEIFGHLLDDGLYKHLNNSYNREKEQIDRLLNHEQAQKEFFKSIIERLL